MLYYQAEKQVCISATQPQRRTSTIKGKMAMRIWSRCRSGELDVKQYKGANPIDVYT